MFYDTGGKDNGMFLIDTAHPIKSEKQHQVTRESAQQYTHPQIKADKLTCKLQPHKLGCCRLSRTEDTLPTRFPGEGKPSCQLLGHQWAQGSSTMAAGRMRGWTLYTPCRHHGPRGSSSLWKKWHKLQVLLSSQKFKYALNLGIQEVLEINEIKR